MKLIQILVGCSGSNFSFSRGKTAEVSNDLAADLVRAGYAKEIERSKPVAVSVEVKEPSENIEIKKAVVTEGRKRKRK